MNVGEDRNRWRWRCFSAIVAVLLPMAVADGIARGETLSGTPFKDICIGLAAHDVGGLWSGRSTEKGPDLWAEMTFRWPLFSFLGADAYPNLGFSLNTRGDTSRVYGGFQLQWPLLTNLEFSTGVGLALHDGERHADTSDRKSLGSPVLIRIPVVLGYFMDGHRWIGIAFDHMSNAGLADPNQGMDTLGLFFGYRF